MGPMRRFRRSRRSVAALCIVAIALAGFLTGLAGLDYAWLEPAWVLLPDHTPVAFADTFAPAPEQPLPLVSPLASRGPPTTTA
jgi:hypothetical protein